MKIFDRAEVQAKLTASACIDVMRDVLVRERREQVVQYLRTAVMLPNSNILGLMPGYDHRGYFGAKILSVYHTNSGSGFPSHQGQILLFGAEHGEVLSVTDAMSVTQIRTGAVSAVATAALARKDSSVLALLGCGAQAESHLQAMAAVLPLKQVTAWDVDPDRSSALAEMARAMGFEAAACETAQEAVRDADVICTLTPSKTPVLKGEWVKPGAHINAVGACRAADRELDSALSARAAFFGDSRESVFHESGDFLIPMQEGLYDESHFRGVIGDVLEGKLPGRTSDGEITVFEALGLAVEDLACAVWLYEGAAADR